MGCKLSLDIRDVDQRSGTKLPVIPYHKDGSTSPPRLSYKDVASSPIVQTTKIQENYSLEKLTQIKCFPLNILCRVFDNMS